MNKIEELKSVVGKEVSENRSPTLRAKLVRVNKKTCTFEVVKSPYKSNTKNNHRAGERYLVPISWSWNAFFF